MFPCFHWNLSPVYNNKSPPPYFFLLFYSIYSNENLEKRKKKSGAFYKNKKNGTWSRKWSDESKFLQIFFDKKLFTFNHFRNQINGACCHFHRKRFREKFGPSYFTRSAFGSKSSESELLWKEIKRYAMKCLIIMCNLVYDFFLHRHF